jgi:predicted  nucleic acid-binding Zn-ribbon protein
MMENLNREVAEAKEKYASLQQEHEEALLRQKTLEGDIATREAELQKYQQQMMSIKTNKEYDALVAQIDAVKTEISSNETELLETIDRIANLEKEIVEAKEKSEQIEENNTRQLGVLQEKIDSIGDKVSAKVSEREQISAQIPRRTLSIYERVRKGKGGTAVVVVKKRACGSCYKALTPRQVQEIKKGDKIHTCENCGSLLFWDNDESN